MKFKKFKKYLVIDNSKDKYFRADDDSIYYISKYYILRYVGDTNNNCITVCFCYKYLDNSNWSYTSQFEKFTTSPEVLNIVDQSNILGDSISKIKLLNDSNKYNL